MAQGKFSKPRPHREEEREIEKAYYQALQKDTPQKTAPRQVPQTSEDFDLDPELELDLEPEEEMEEERDGLGAVLGFFSAHKNALLLGICAGALVLIVAFMVIFFTGTSDPYDGKILSNVYIADINVGGMTKSEAMDAVRYATDESFSAEYMVIDLAGTTLRLVPSEVGAKLDIKAVVNAAYAYGRTGSQSQQDRDYQASLRGSHHTIGLLPYLEFNEAYIRDVLGTYAQDSGSTLVQHAYGLEGTQPELALDKFDENTPGQTLVITMGTPGISFDMDGVYEQILDAYSLHKFLVVVDDVKPVMEPDELDLDAIYTEFFIEPVDSRVDMQTFETIPGSYGYGFDLEEAKRLVAAAEYGEEIRIPMEIIEPEVMESEVLFQDVLGECQTPHNDNENRNNNLRIACATLDGLVLDPGETFSFNEVLGQRTADRGYKPAPAYSGVELVDSLGGGICQVSSTLYYCTLLSDLTTVFRANHGFPASYIDYGMDATVSWGTTDFKFMNSTNFPIKIEAEVSDGYVKMRILGTDERDYYVEMEYEITGTIQPDTEYKDYPADNPEGYKDGDVVSYGKKGYYVKTYKLKYDKETGKLLSRDFETRSSYMTKPQVIARVEGSVATDPSDPSQGTESTVPSEGSQPTDPPVTDPAPTDPPPTIPEEAG